MNKHQAAGVVTIAHRSGGPAADIIVPLPDGRITGFLAETPEEYAEAMAKVFGGEAASRQGGEKGSFSSGAVRVAGRESARRFSNEVFDRTFGAEFVELLQRRRSGSLNFAAFGRKQIKEE